MERIYLVKMRELSLVDKAFAFNIKIHNTVLEPVFYLTRTRCGVKIEFKMLNIFSSMSCFLRGASASPCGPVLWLFTAPCLCHLILLCAASLGWNLEQAISGFFSDIHFPVKIEFLITGFSRLFFVRDSVLVCHGCE